MKKISTRQKIINSAHKLFYQRGFNGTSIDDVLQDSGLNKGSLYHIFKSKKEVLLAVIEEKIAYDLEQKYKNILTEKEPLKYLEKILLTTDSFDFKHGCALNNLVQEMSPVNEDVAKALLKIYNDLEHYYFIALRKENLDTAQKKSLSKMMLATVEGAIMAAKAAQNKAPYLQVIKQMFELI